MSKPILLNSVEYSMLELIAKKKSRLKPEQYLKKLIQDEYDKTR
jgi:hypothetical protein